MTRNRVRNPPEQKKSPAALGMSFLWAVPDPMNNSDCAGSKPAMKNVIQNANCTKNVPSENTTDHGIPFSLTGPPPRIVSSEGGVLSCGQGGIAE